MYEKDITHSSMTTSTQRHITNNHTELYDHKCSETQKIITQSYMTTSTQRHIKNNHTELYDHSTQRHK